jgi:hypothetical protein
MNASDAYSILYLFNKEIRKTSKTLSLGNVFSEAAWAVAQDEMEAAVAYGKRPVIDKMGRDRCIKLANALECGQMNMKTLKVYMVGEYIRKNKGCFFKRKKDGSLYMKGTKKDPDKKKVVYNAVDIESIGRLEGIDLYKPENLKKQLEILKEAAQTNVSVINPRENQTNVLYDLLCEGKIGLHLYLHLWNLNDGFGIDVNSKAAEEEYKRFLKMVQWLVKDGFDLNDIWFHDRA